MKKISRLVKIILSSIMILSPIVWVFYDFSLFAKIFVTSFVFIVFINFINKLYSKNEVTETIEKESKRYNLNHKSRFQQKMEEMINNSKKV